MAIACPQPSLKGTTMETVKFTQMRDGDREDYVFLTEHEKAYATGTGDRLLAAMVDLDKSLSGYKVTRLGHSLQSATRAWNVGADIDWVVSALLHDIGTSTRPTIMTNTLQRSFGRSCGNNARGSSRNTVISNCCTTANMSVRTRTSATRTVTALTLMIARNSARSGTSRALIRISRPSLWSSSLRWCAKSSLARAMIQP